MVLLPPDGVLITVKGQLAVSPMPKGVDVMLSCAAIRELVAKKVISMDAVLLGSLRGGGDSTLTVSTGIECITHPNIALTPSSNRAKAGKMRRDKSEADVKAALQARAGSSGAHTCCG